MDSFSQSLCLTTEQEFTFVRFKQDVSALKLSKDAEDLILNMQRQIMIKDNVIKHFMRKSL
jgi:hypothetical protein